MYLCECEHVYLLKDYWFAIASLFSLWMESFHVNIFTPPKALHDFIWHVNNVKKRTAFSIIDMWIFHSMDMTDSMFPPYSTRHLRSEPVTCPVQLKQKFCIMHIARKPMGSWQEKILSQPNSISLKVMLQNLHFLLDMIALTDIYK